MKTLISAVAALALVAGGCATSSTTSREAQGTIYAGEVWTWDERENIVTLRQGTERIRVRVTPEQIRNLTLHSNVRLRGELAPPAEIARVVTQPGPTMPVPRGTAVQTEVTGSVATVTPEGRMSVNTARGPLHVWVAQGADQRFPVGAEVRVTTAVQPVDLVPVSAASAAPSASVPMPSTPGDHSTVTGRIIGVNPGGSLVVESPTGPIQIWVSNASGFALSEPVQVRTTVVRTP